MDEKALEAALKAFYNDKLDRLERMRSAITAYLEASGIQNSADRIDRLNGRILDFEDENDVLRKHIAALEREIRILDARGE